MESPTINITRFTKCIVASTINLVTPVIQRIVLSAIQMDSRVVQSIVQHFKQCNKLWNPLLLI